MSMKDVIKKLVPTRLKSWMKEEIGTSTQYTLQISDVKMLEGKTAIVTGVVCAPSSRQETMKVFL